MKKVVISSVITAVGVLLLCAIIIGACIYSAINQPNLDFWDSISSIRNGLALGFPLFVSLAIFLFGLISLLTQFFQKD